MEDNFLFFKSRWLIDTLRLFEILVEKFMEELVGMDGSFFLLRR